MHAAGVPTTRSLAAVATNQVAPALVQALIAPMLVDIADGRGHWPVFAESAILTVLSGGEGFKIGRADVHALYTPGHAVHHLAYHVGDELFAGDVGGIRLLGKQTPRAPTPPPGRPRS